jgi:hypothetical protein
VWPKSQPADEFKIQGLHWSMRMRARSAMQSEWTDVRTRSKV